MDAGLFETLLHDGEGSRLDFKRDQYPFSGATDEQKGELLKDILAFANTHHQTDAYILIGVEEVKGGRSIPRGISGHLDDASVQQFINAKTNRPVTFAYDAREFDGALIGVIHIPPQEGPFFVKNDFGKVRKNIVYRRQGSSTAEVNPDELFRTARTKRLSPSLEFAFADITNKRLLGQELSIVSNYLNPMDQKEIADFGHGGYLRVGSFGFNADFYREMNEFLFFNSITKSLGFVLSNQSGETLQDVQAEILIPKQKDTLVFDESSIPKRPSKQPALLVGHKSLSSLISNDDIIVSEHGNNWLLLVKFGKVQPKAVAWTGSVLYIGSLKTKQLKCEAVLYADNLSDPQRVPLEINFEFVEGGEINYKTMNDEADDDSE